MGFEWTVPQVFIDIPEREYINDCCTGGDDVLAQFKDAITSQMNFDKNKITIYQEDWGWVLEFAKDEVFYFLGISNAGEVENKTLFTVQIEVNKKVKKFLFTKKIEAANELKEFAEMVSRIAKSNGFEVN